MAVPARWRTRAALLDGAVVGLVVVLAQMDAWTRLLNTDRRGPAWVACLALTGMALTLVLRRQRPLLTVIAISVIVLAWWLVQGVPPVSSAASVALMVASFSVGRWEANRRLALVGAAVVGVVLAVHLLAAPVVTLALVRDEAPWVLLVLGLWLLGAYLRYRSLYVLGLREAVAQGERARIARELHDVVAHGVSVMVIQSEAAEELLAHGDPDRAAAALRNVQSVGRDTLTGLRATLGLLRAGPAADRSPQPGVDQAVDLADRMRAAGMDVTLRVRGQSHHLSPAVSLVAYRVMQEALTNTLKHSSARAADVDLTFGSHDLVVQVHDDGPAHDGDHTPGGAGLTGMRERVTAVGGRLQAGPSADGGFAVRATLPNRAAP
jgi:signal transduction histidine kinase